MTSAVPFRKSRRLIMLGISLKKELTRVLRMVWHFYLCDRTKPTAGARDLIIRNITDMLSTEEDTLQCCAKACGFDDRHSKQPRRPRRVAATLARLCLAFRSLDVALAELRAGLHVSVARRWRLHDICHHF